MPVRALQPFRHQQYRVLALAMLISVFGHGLWAVSMVYQVRALGGGLLELSLTTTSLSIGLLTCVLIGGIAADRLPKHRILLAVEITDAITIGIVAVLSLTGTLQLWHLVVVAGLVGASASFFFPAYSALLPGILPPQDLLAANGLEGTARPALSLAAGPALAGVIVAAASPGAALALLALCHVAASLVLTRLGSATQGAPQDAASPNAAAGDPAAGASTRRRARKTPNPRPAPFTSWQRGCATHAAPRGCCGHCCSLASRCSPPWVRWRCCCRLWSRISWAAIRPCLVGCWRWWESAPWWAPS